MDANDHIPLSEAAQLIPGRPHTSAVWRWCRNGILTRSGERIRLAHVRVGGRLFTSRSAIEQFVQATTASDCEYFEPSETRSEHRRNASSLAQEKGGGDAIPFDALSRASGTE